MDTGTLCTCLSDLLWTKNKVFFFPSDSMKKTKRQTQTGRWYSQHILTVNTLVPRFYAKFPNSKSALSHLSFAGHFPNNRLIPGISPQGNFHNSLPSNLIPLKIQVYLGHGYFFYLWPLPMPCLWKPLSWNFPLSRYIDHISQTP